MRTHPEWRVLNHGVNGERSDQIRVRLELMARTWKRGSQKLRSAPDPHGIDPDLIVLIAGVNDIYQGRSAESVQDELAAMYDLARRAAIPIVAGTILPYNSATGDQNIRMHAVNAWIGDHAAPRDDMAFCDTRAAVARPDDPDRLVSSPDDLHPSPEGYRQMALALEPVIRGLLARPMRRS